MKKALILFTRAPIAGKTKTRLLDFLTPQQAANLHKFLLKDINTKLQKLKNVKIFIFFTPSDKAKILEQILGKKYEFIAQSEGSLSERMLEAFKYVKTLGYEQILLIGSDIVNFTAQGFNSYFKALGKNDAAIAPTLDGGYCAIALRSASLRDEIFSSDYSFLDSVCEGVCAKFEELNLNYVKFKPLRDIDTKEDIFAYILGVRPSAIKPLANGEYNINYKFRKGGQKVFRINTKSQMALENQIKYEFDALKILQSSKVTPAPLEYYEPSPLLPRGAMSMEFLKGRALRYESDLETAASLLASVHAVKIPSNHSLITAQKPLKAMFEECEKMANIYLDSNLAQPKTAEMIEFFLKIAKKFDLEREIEEPCIINTELNSSNFIIGKESSYIIDWEKPIIGEREQDLAHFSVPTTTFWKTDVIFSADEIEKFINLYENYSKKMIDRRKFKEYFTMTCLRGTSWCAMAFVEYNGARAIKNEYTFNKIKAYLSDKFLSNLQQYFKEFR